MTKQSWSIPLKQAIPMLLVAVSAVAFVLNERAERRELRRIIQDAAEDRFQGKDMDRLLERAQVVLDKHTRQTDSPDLHVPGWRR